MVASDSLSSPVGTVRPQDDPVALAHVREVVASSGSSFTAGMRSLPPARRDAMFAVYAFCREVDDIADEPDTEAAKRSGLDGWRREVDRLYAGEPHHPTARALSRAIVDYDLPKGEFHAIIDGMEMDVDDTIQAPSLEVFWLYCRRVAGAVGMLSVRIFGAHSKTADDLAVTLGEALQTTNILRDLAEDAQRGRLYLPRELLAAQGLADCDPRALLDDPRLVPVCEALAEIAHARFARARALLAQCDRRTLRPAVLMLEAYVRILAKLERRGWNRPRQAVSLSKATKLWVGLRYGLI